MYIKNTLIVMIILLIVPVVHAASHAQFNIFSAPEDFSVTDNVVSVTDDAVYRTGWYSINGNNWQSFSLEGTSYDSSASWLTGSATAYLPSFGYGEHYVIIYGCSYDVDWDCHGTWQLQVIDGGTPPLEENIFYVAPNGDDNNPGTIDSPWATWSKAFHTAQAGDTVYFRGGTYPIEVTDGSGIRYIPSEDLGYDGTADNWINYFAYPGEVPILDGSESFATGDSPLSLGLYTDGVDYVHIKGLHIKNFFQRTYPNSRGTYDIPYAVNTRHSNHLKFENVVTSNTQGIGFESYNDYYIEYINCDSHSHTDVYHATLPGGYGAGWHGSGNITTGYKYLYGCRAWNNSDQGYSTSGTPYLMVIDSCWSFDNGRGEIVGDGVGFKLGYWSNPNTISPVIIMRNSIAANNSGTGYTGNEYSTSHVGAYHLFNNFAYLNDRFGFVVNPTSSSDEEELERTLRNNLAYRSGIVEINDYLAEYTHSHNSWELPVVIDDNDFVSLDVSQLHRPRKADGSLPDITFGHLVEGSDLIDAGTDVDLDYQGNAPDIGHFESSYTTVLEGTCDDGIMNQNELHIDCGGSCSACVLDGDYYVAPYGDDNNPGTIDLPWATWSKAFHTAQPGELVYFRDGIYLSEITDGSGIKYVPADGLGFDGTAANPIRYFAYPGETPVLDASNSFLTGENVYTSKALFFNGVDYVHVKGLEIKNLFQRPHPNSNGNYDIITAFEIHYANNTIIENCVVHSVDGIAFRSMYAHNLDFINCDAYNASDHLHETLPGSYGTGFSISGVSSTTGLVTLTGCRAWACGDQGYSSAWGARTVFNECWAFDNGLDEGSGNGFKTSANNNPHPETVSREFNNCIAARNGNPSPDHVGDGFTTNDNDDLRGFGYNVTYNNCFAYNDERYGFISYVGASPGIRRYNNNIAYAARGMVDARMMGEVNYYHNNSWDSPVVVTDDDFVSLDVNQLYRPRKADGSLPDITFGHLAEGSDLIDAGFNVGLPYQGNAPDLGAFEYQS